MLLLTAPTFLRADVRPPSLFTPHMVLQRGQENRVWGWADAAESVTVSICGQAQSTTADAEGRWSVQLEPLEAGGPFVLGVKGQNTIEIADVMVGEVWVCSGQSNMAFSVNRADDPDLEMLAANYPHIRLISVPQVGTQEPQEDFSGQWEPCTPETVGDFSAVGYFFGRQLHQTLEVPIGLIDNAWGGSACEAWVRRDLLAADDQYTELMERWAQTESTYDHEKQMEAYRQRLGACDEGGKKAQRPSPPRNPLTGQHRPANLYNGVLKPIIGYGIRGAIWYQGESNASRAYQYRTLFPLMIQSWRDEWGQGDFPFYWAQLADFRDEQPEPQESSWAELREAQTMTMSKLPNTGEAVIIDIGEGRDIHPRNKQGVGKRLARWALAKDYGIEVACQSPTYQSMVVTGGKIVVTFDHVGPGLYTFDVNRPLGFAIAGEDRAFVWADAKLVGSDKVEVWSDQVPDPVAVRYAWADNPVCNLQSRNGLPATPFRTDDWPGMTIDAR
jgi:sialate O-acetylesterase